MASAANNSGSAQLILFVFVLISTCFLLPLSLDAQENNSVAVESSALPPFSFSFNFTNASSYAQNDVQFEGNAEMHSKMIDLTCDSYGQEIDGCMGRMSYNHPVQFHDGTTVASFSTSFTFMILAESEEAPGDGMAFFLSSYPSKMPSQSGGGYLGLLTSGTTPYGEAQFVAVEFDTFRNEWDPNDNHIGIDINSLTSLNVTTISNATSSLLPRLRLNGTMTATIQFNSSSMMLVASLRFHEYPLLEPVEVSKVLLDPMTLLPPKVAVGFSAATGTAAELHKIVAWSFNSTLAPTPDIEGGHLGNIKMKLPTGISLSLSGECHRTVTKTGNFENCAERVSSP